LRKECPEIGWGKWTVEEPKQALPLMNVLTGDTCWSEEDGTHALTLDAYGYQ